MTFLILLPLTLFNRMSQHFNPAHIDGYNIQQQQYERLRKINRMIKIPLLTKKCIVRAFIPHIHEIDQLLQTLVLMQQ